MASLYPFDALQHVGLRLSHLGGPFQPDKEAEPRSAIDRLKLAGNRANFPRVLQLVSEQLIGSSHTSMTALKRRSPLLTGTADPHRMVYKSNEQKQLPVTV